MPICIFRIFLAFGPIIPASFQDRIEQIIKSLLLPHLARQAKMDPIEQPCIPVNEMTPTVGSGITVGEVAEAAEGQRRVVYADYDTKGVMFQIVSGHL